MFAKPARLIYFAETARDTETAEQARGEKGEDPRELEKKVKIAQEIERTTGVIGTEALKNLKGSKLDSFVREASLGQLDAVLKEAKDLAALRGSTDKLVAKLIASPHLSAAARNRLQKLSAKAGAGKVKNLDAFRELAQQAEAQIGRLPLAAAATHEFQKLTALGGAELFADVKITVKSESGGTQTLTGRIAPNAFRDLSLTQKNAYLQALRDSIGSGGTTEKAAAAVKLRNQLLADSAVPDSWKAWLQNPAEYGHTLEYAANWVDENLGPLLVSTEKYRALTEQVNRFPHGTEKLAAAGVRLESTDDFQARSRHERDAYLDEVATALAQIDADLAAGATAAGAQNRAESHGIAHEMDASAAEEAKILQANLAEMGHRVVQSPVYDVFQNALKTEKAAVLARAEQQAALQKTAQMRRGGEGGSVLGALAERFGLKKGEAANDTINEAAINEQAGKNAIENFLAEEKNQTATKELLGVTSSDPEDLKRAANIILTRDAANLLGDQAEFQKQLNEPEILKFLRQKTKLMEKKSA